eukprot:2582158-Rhodomonas_salina.1
MDFCTRVLPIKSIRAFEQRKRKERRGEGRGRRKRRERRQGVRGRVHRCAWEGTQVCVGGYTGVRGRVGWVWIGGWRGCVWEERMGEEGRGAPGTW